MAGVDSLLRIVAQHSGDELRLGSDQEPRMFQKGHRLRLSIPATPDEMLRLLLAPLLTPAHDATLEAQGHVELQYTSGDGDAYAVTLQKSQRPGAPRGTTAFEAIFCRGTVHAARSSSLPVAAAPVESTRPTMSPAPVSIGAGRTADGATLPPALSALLRRAVSLSASDIHLCNGAPAFLRVDGMLRALPELVSADVEEMVGGCLDAKGRALLADGRSVDLAVDLPESGRFRFNIYRSSTGLAAAIRILPRFAPPLSELHLPISLDEVTSLPHGLVIVCGPTGSGKSATLAALAQAALIRRGGLLVTLEDPIEYGIRPDHNGQSGQNGASLVRQRQIGADVRDFSTGLRDALREDPDILLIGEMRDPESIGLALTAAETGHLVLTSLHSRSAPSTIERIVDSYPPERQQQIRVQLADSLRAVIAQRLLPRANGKGRLPAVEVLRGNHTVANLIREGKTAQIATVIQSSKKDGMLPLERCLADMVRTGQISREVAVSAANDTASLGLFLQS